MNFDDLADRASRFVEDGPEDTENLHWFVVGGAVRDCLRNEQPSDMDFVVTGEDEDSMLDRGFTLVDNSGTDTFPVFLNSEGEEFALARTEKLANDSDGNPHRAFEVDIENVSLEEDLNRRDFTVNAMAVSPEGKHIDPHGGTLDLQSGVIRHVSDAFKEDPLRVLRGARFAARLDASLASETKEIMLDVVNQIPSLPGERLRMEMVKALKQADQPRVFFDTLNDLQKPGIPSALTVAFPEVAALNGVPAGPHEHHREGSAFEHTMMVLEEANELCPNDELLLLMALAHDLGKQNTPIDKWPKHHGHGNAGLDVIEEMDERLRFSNRQVTAMRDAAKHHMRIKHIEEMRAATVFDFTKEVRFPDRLIDLAVADARGKEPAAEFDRELAETRFRAARRARERLTGADLIEQGISPEEIGGEQFGKNLRDKRISIMKGIESEHNP